MCGLGTHKRASVRSSHTPLYAAPPICRTLQAMLGALPLAVVMVALALLAATPGTTAFKLPLRMVGDSRKGQQVSRQAGTQGLD
jgi:hypothetical protein